MQILFHFIQGFCFIKKKIHQSNLYQEVPMLTSSNFPYVFFDIIHHCIKIIPGIILPQPLMPFSCICVIIPICWLRSMENPTYLENTWFGKVVTHRKRKGNGEESLADHVLLQLLGTAKYQEQPHGGAIEKQTWVHWTKFKELEQPAGVDRITSSSMAEVIGLERRAMSQATCLGLGFLKIETYSNALEIIRFNVADYFKCMYICDYKSVPYMFVSWTSKHQFILTNFFLLNLFKLSKKLLS